jgi:hypothetical protein
MIVTVLQVTRRDAATLQVLRASHNPDMLAVRCRGAFLKEQRWLQDSEHLAKPHAAAAKCVPSLPLLWTFGHRIAFPD